MPSPRHDEITRRAAASEARAVVIEADGGLSREEKNTALASEKSATLIERRRYKAAECVADLTGSLPIQVDLGGGRSANILTAETPPNDDAVKITVSVTRGGNDLTPAGLNPWIISNPPMLVTDPAGDVIIEAINGNGDSVQRIFREDPIAIVVDVVKRKLA